MKGIWISHKLDNQHTYIQEHTVGRRENENLNKIQVDDNCGSKNLPLLDLKKNNLNFKVVRELNTSFHLNPYGSEWVIIIKYVNIK
jgi:mRNA deadenylase 3'-5' endonuclease subunit Ccr4